MGTQKRQDIAEKKNVPGPGNYSHKSAIGEGPKVGLSPRLEAQKPTTLAPGPGAYNPNPNVVSEKTPAVGMGYGSRGELQNKTKAAVPGPGAYATTNEKKEGPKFGFGTSQRTTHKASPNPGPGNYELESSISALPPHERSKMK